MSSAPGQLTRCDGLSKRSSSLRGEVHKQSLSVSASLAEGAQFYTRYYDVGTGMLEGKHQSSMEGLWSRSTIVTRACTPCPEVQTEGSL